MTAELHAPQEISGGHRPPLQQDANIDNLSVTFTVPVRSTAP